MYTKILTRSKIKSFKIKIYFQGSGGGVVRGWPDVPKMRYFLEQDNWGCIINNQ